MFFGGILWAVSIVVGYFLAAAADACSGGLTQSFQGPCAGPGNNNNLHY